MFCFVLLYVIHTVKYGGMESILSRRLKYFDRNPGLVSWLATSNRQVAKWPLLIYLHGSGGGTFLSFTKRSLHCEGVTLS